MKPPAAALLFDAFVVLAALVACAVFHAPWNTFTAITAGVLGARIANVPRPPSGGDGNDGTPRGVPRLGGVDNAAPRALAQSGAVALARGGLDLARWCLPARWRRT